MRSANIIRMFAAIFAVSATLDVSSAPAAATQTQLNEFDGSLCRLLNVSSDPQPIGGGYSSTIDTTGLLIHPPSSGASTVSFLCPATLSGNILNLPYATKNILFTVELSDTTGHNQPVSCQGEFDTVSGGVYVINPAAFPTLQGVVNGVLDMGPFPPVNRAFFLCHAAATSLLYLRSYSLTLTYVLP